jgi:hypothetical protein
MSDLDARTLPLLELLHVAPGDSDAWLRFLAALRDAISKDVEVLFAAQPQGRSPGTLAGSDSGIRRVRLDEVLRPSLPHPGLLELPIGAVQPLGAENPLAKSVLFREVLAPRGLLPGPGFVVVLERTERFVVSAVLVLPRSRGWKLRPDARALLERLGPHMVVARKLQIRFEDRRRHADALISAFDRLALGVLFLDENARVSYTNRSAAEMELGLEWIAEIGAHGVVAGPDASLHEQPSNAIKAACAKEGIDPADLDLIEINEAFAAVAIQSIKDLGVSPDIVNVNGGAIALGHPIGMSGARLVLSLALELRRRGGGLGAAALCGGGGQGDALIINVPITA